ncbi:hypothetical protein [Corallococcus llansteffanensis]|uniref:Uncharacterized protein n=1 Tax=Corallococcus llansteffanensis TaxID=2316731 RepID=A0A3A8QPF1_9BACT|nr:hypothetical protein [Corallococcus llansteffanensis]RKH68760.1 hypothetical protein D7V93_00785 [Corallococcus llansteffanensis]
MRGFVVAVMSAGMLMGCGGVEVEQEGPEVEEPQDTTQLMACSQDYLIEYYKNSTRTQLVGTQQCTCNAMPTSTGTTVGYRVVVYRYECFGVAAQ